MGDDKISIKRAGKNTMWKTPEQIKREMADVANPKWEKEVEHVGDSQKQTVKDKQGNDVQVHTAMSQFLVNQAKANGPPVFKFQIKEAAEKARKAKEAADKDKGKGKENEKPEIPSNSSHERHISKSICASNRRDLKTSVVGGRHKTAADQGQSSTLFVSIKRSTL